MKKQVILDLDDVQADLFSDLRKQFNKHMGVYKKERDFTTFDITQVYEGLDMSTFYLVLEDAGVIERLRPLEGAVEATQRMSKLGYQINVVTARGWHSDGLKASQDWLEKHGFYFDRLSISDPNTSKKDVYKHFAGHFDLIVDDHVKNIDHALDSGLFESVALISRPWNEQDKRFRYGSNRYNSLQDVVAALPEAV